MAAAAMFSTRIYGEIEGNLPFQDATGATAFTRVKPWPHPAIMAIPTEGTTIAPLTNGVLVSNFYVYSVITMPPTGLNVHGTKLVSDTSAASLATLAG